METPLKIWKLRTYAEYIGLKHTFKLAKNILLSVRQGPNQGDKYSFLFVTNLLESKTESLHR